MKDSYRSRLLLALSMAIFGTLAPFVRHISISSGELALWRATLATLLIALFLLITRQKIPFRQIKKELPLLLLSGIAMGINWILLFEAYKYTSVSAATLSYYFAPILVTALCPLLFREKLHTKQIVCFVFATVGIVLITGIGTVEENGRDLIGILFGLGAAVFYATVILLNKRIQSVGGIHRTFLQFIASILILVPYVFMSDGIHLGNLDRTGWICLLTVGLLHTGVTYCMYFSSLSQLSGQKAAILSYIDPLVAILLSVFVLKESMSPLQWIGAALILGFTLWNEIEPKKKLKENQE